MGGAVSESIFSSKYDKERSQLRKALIQSFIGNSENEHILSKISAVRSIITQHPEYCITASRELEHKFEYSPTSIQAAEIELDRLFTIYETHTILKSVQCRIGPIACPLGHYCSYFGDFKSQHLMNNGKKKQITCSLCDKNTNSGYQCSYCSYTLCLPCGNIYCCNGHVCKLWTYAEAQHCCIVCNKFPINAGYRCKDCIDYDICDLCTAKPGRKQVQQIILNRMEEYLKYMDDHKTESETALKTLAQHRVKVKTNSYAHTLELFNFEQSLVKVKEICKEEVLLTRRTKEVLRLRKIITVGAETGLSVTALVESKIEGRYTYEEIDRLMVYAKWIERESSVLVRSKHVIACPLGHAMHPFKGKPLLYLRRDSSISLKKEGKTLAICKVCDRAITPEGYHCEFCEYDLCTTCSIIYCYEGHPMKMWIVPDAMNISCTMCNAKNLTSGYYCQICDQHTCDISTSKAARGNIRNKWELEMKSLISFMKANKRFSGVAHYYHWRHNNFIVSIGALTEYVRELRTAKIQAEHQIEQKSIIDRIKQMRIQIAKDVLYSATAIRETDKPQHYIYKNMKAAIKEANRLQNIIDNGLSLQTFDIRHKCGVACPLGHGMDVISEQPQEYESLPPYIPSLETNEAKLFMSNPTKAIDFVSKEVLQIEAHISSIQDSIQNINTSIISTDSLSLMIPDKYVDKKVISSIQLKRLCRVCGTNDLINGHCCLLCEYDLCLDCSVIYCRLGHSLQIWTLSDAVALSCDMCRCTPITRGYRCKVCDIDVCDLCTTKDSRNAFMLWPRRELNKTLNHLKLLKDDSLIAKTYLLEDNIELKSKYINSMSILCKKLKEAQDIVLHSEEEIELRKQKLKAKTYGFKAIDM